MGDGYFDLFGVEVPEWRGKRGRPPHVPTEKTRNRVSMLLALGWDNERIANALGVSEPTLRKHYFTELKRRAIAQDMLEAKQFERLFELGFQEGNVGAIKEFNRLVERDRLSSTAKAFDKIAKAERPKAEKLGKKEIAQREAEAIASGSSLWGDDLNFKGSVN
ncbi:AraC family transcriptional regulator [Rhizobium sp. G21]|uniref:AraC family transcriptional regulator n=1 Tax=Rhizobium sp. G21 TaxID=2758439 RepID=UPI001FEDBBF1|nr:AraC family transcriptional regulator [Rhizobium sp. G21]